MLFETCANNGAWRQFQCLASMRKHFASYEATVHAPCQTSCHQKVCALFDQTSHLSVKMNEYWAILELQGVMVYVILEKDGKVSKCHVVGQGQRDAGIDISEGIYFTSFAQTQVPGMWPVKLIFGLSWSVYVRLGVCCYVWACLRVYLLDCVRFLWLGLSTSLYCGMSPYCERIYVRTFIEVLFVHKRWCKHT